ncbi:NYN domain-containing protein [Microbispora triticiradicis]|uniref:NYN domain-containing protein n=1 Tax=Microbispora TaxID=2005 RepID=UPI0021CCF72F|nr:MULTISPECIES: NYN domain-containing protein [Microbispora]
MDRCALFVDAGYLLADGAMAVHGTRHREAVSWDYPGLLRFLTNLSRERTGLPLLRCYWYEATVEGRRTPEHDVLADIPGLKLRLGRIRPGRREGVDAQVHRDLMTLARNNAVCDAVVVSGDEDLTQVVSDAQDLGVRVTVMQLAADGAWSAARTLRQECDDLVEIAGAHLRSYVTLSTAVDTSLNTGNGQHQLTAGNGQHHGNGVVAHANGSHPQGSQQYGSQSQAGYILGSHTPGLPASGGHDNASYGSGSRSSGAHGASTPGTSSPDTATPGLPASGTPASDGLPQSGGSHGSGAHGSGSHSAGSHGTGSHGAGSRDSGSLGPASPGGSSLGGSSLGGSSLGGSLGGGAHSTGAHSSGSHASGSGAQGSGAHASGTAGPGGHTSGGYPSGDHSSGGLGSGAQDSGAQGAGAFGSGAHGTGAHGSGVHGSGAQGSGAHGSGAHGPGAQGSETHSSEAHSSGTHSSGAHGSGAHGGGRSSGHARPVLPAQPSPPAYNGYPPEPQQSPGQPQQRPAPPSPSMPPPSMPLPAPPAPPAGQAPPTTPLNSQYASGPVGYPPSQLGPYTGPQPAPVPMQPGGTTTLAEAVQAAHKEGHDFGESVARDAPALWLEAVLARKPRMPSDLEARLLQGSSLPIDFLLHDEVRHALRRGFWDALERARR